MRYDLNNYAVIETPEGFFLIPSYRKGAHPGATVHIDATTLSKAATYLSEYAVCRAEGHTHPESRANALRRMKEVIG